MVFGWFQKSPTAPQNKTPPVPQFEQTTAETPAAKPGAAKSVSDSEALRLQRANLYEVIRECMIASGILSAGYKFKVLSADAQHQQFLVLFDLAPEFSTDTNQLQSMEQLIQTTALRRYRLLVKTCYWRVTPDPAMANASEPAAAADDETLTPAPAQQSTTAEARAQLAALFPNGVPQGQETGFAPTEFATSPGALPDKAEKATSYVMLTGYESTELAQSEFRSTEMQPKP